ncbi:sulfite oxidase heme-binding subunit YedZ [Glaciecola petra]|uniref:Ferric reductase-like transmembrane domain-containing protein n=1 Tax=Glaciecola petra TaxID=3075602 RepID=A0ABU2ZSA5_9ALTE|nr:ferric reductase-like transmembrane domain-containing protein [Aestuariibacter sp. P117]MDT0594322.1 ferric reductase-like transmembrane domain-containing protein [Aestuariibacter sp. P117]
MQYLLDFTGIGALNLLLLSLTISPLSRVFKFIQLIRIRKTLGVYAAIYALSHFGVFIVFELQFEWRLIVSEIIDRPYITVGFCSLFILSLLLVSSFDFAKSKLKRNWQRLHNWVYLALALACLHFLWSIKSTEIEAIIYFAMGIAALLLRRDKLLKPLKQKIIKNRK